VTARFVAGPPSGPVVVPPAVLSVAAGEPVEPVWHNERGGLTFALPATRRYVKWQPAGPGPDLAQEAARLAWAAPFTPVPAVLAAGSNGEGSWLVTAALPGSSAVSARWVADPAVAAAAIGTGLRALHDALPVGSCPFDWGVAARLARADERGSGSPAERAALGGAPAVDRLVVCHGDACAPNTLLDEAGRWTGHVDLGALGVADRWADLAVATWSLEWNYGPGWDGVLLEAYGVALDDERTGYYRRLWDAT
jgi:kanamycin kinase